MSARRVLAIGVDGFEETLESRLIEAGELPALARLREQSSRYLLDHGSAQRTGLAWEHFSTGLSPARAGRWSAVHFDPATYAVWQQGTSFKPFVANLSSRAVVFDAPYFDLEQAPGVRGLVAWGAHDPGMPMSARPAELLSEFARRFGEYPAKDWIYGHVWPSATRAKEMGEALARAVDLRARAARWLLGERLPDWDLGIVIVSEPHSAIEGLWHGIDDAHPLHQLPSAGPARAGLVAVYRAVDRLVGELAAAFPDATLVVFSMGGMGPNRSDVTSMVLLPELMYRYAFGKPYLRQPDAWTEVSGPGPLLSEQDDWARAINANLPFVPSARPDGRVGKEGFLEPLKRALSHGMGLDRCADKIPIRPPIGWIPAARYQPHWRSMPAFALPSYYDGRIRINLAGRERKGIVRISEYETQCDEIEALLRECRDPATGEGVVDYVERAENRNPLTMGQTEADLTVVWKGSSCALDHPRLGRVGPVPFRRPGGHTGRFGFAYIDNADLAIAKVGVRSAFDVAPTLVELLGEPALRELSGVSLLATSIAAGVKGEGSPGGVDRCAP